MKGGGKGGKGEGLSRCIHLCRAAPVSPGTAAAETVGIRMFSHLGTL